MSFYFAQIFGILAWIILIISYWKSGSSKILYLQIISCIFFSLNYFMLGAYTGLFIVLFEIVRDYLYIKIKSSDKVFKYSIPFYIFIAILSYSNIYSIFCVLASLCDSYALSKKDNRTVVYGIITYLFWIIYDISFGSYGTVVMEVFIIISNLIFLYNSYSVYLRSDGLRVEKGLSITDNMLKIFNSLDKDNYNNHFLWSIGKEKEIIRNNKSDYIFIYDSNEIVGYVNFIRITNSKYEDITCGDIRIRYSDIKKFTKKTGNYININSISIKNIYKNDRVKKLVIDAVKGYLVRKYKYGYKISGIISVGLDNFECSVLEGSGFRKERNKKYNIYTLEDKKLDKYLGI